MSARGLLTRIPLGAATALVAGVTAALAIAAPAEWSREWPKTDFRKASVPYEEIISGGPPKDGIPPIDNPEFVAVAAKGACRHANR